MKLICEVVCGLHTVNRCVRRTLTVNCHEPRSVTQAGFANAVNFKRVHVTCPKKKTLSTPIKGIQLVKVK